MKLYCAFITIFLLVSCSDDTTTSKSSPNRIGKLFPERTDFQLNEKDLELLQRNEFREFVKIEPDEFLMGSPKSEDGRNPNELEHRVILTLPYYISKIETTVDQWNQSNMKIKMYEEFEPSDEIKLVIQGVYNTLKNKNELVGKTEEKFLQHLASFSNIGQKEQLTDYRKIDKILALWSNGNPGFRNSVSNFCSLPPPEITKKLKELIDDQKNLPVSNISYTQAVAYCHDRTEQAYRKNLLPKDMVFRLPTEAEWEFACRAGNESPCGIGTGNSLSGNNANLDGSEKGFIIGKFESFEYKRGLIPVSRFPSNNWGLYDMHGNVMEWCYDFYGDYPAGEVTNPIGPIKGITRVLRGGSWFKTAYQCRSASRHKLEPSYRGSETGFRVVLGYPLR